MLYDTSEQLEVRHVISLAHYLVDIYSGGDPIPEGELWIKRNCIRLAQRDTSENIGDSKPFYLFSDNCSEKEDFYHAMLRSQETHVDPSPNPPLPLKFNTTDLIKLVQQLHASEENLHTRWINALIGRLFLAMYKTRDIEQFIWTKITKKIARVPKPSLISSVNVQKIDMGHLPPFLTNPKLKELTVDGDLTVEADVSYKGDFRLEIAAVARIELGSRFKPREVTLILATMLKKLDGHILIRIKPPPSNRLWVTFETPPTMDLSLEPIVSSRQITYGVILRAIESRIRETVAETLVFPNWDDIPFSDTLSHQFRGGLWTVDKGEGETFSSGNTIAPDTEPLVRLDLDEAAEPDTVPIPSSDSVKSMPTLGRSPTLSNRRAAQSEVDLNDESVGASSAISQWSHVKPRALRSSSYASAATPIVNADSAIPKFDERKGQDDAAISMKTTVARSPPSSPPGLLTEAFQHSMSDRRQESSPSSYAEETSLESRSSDDSSAPHPTPTVPATPPPTRPRSVTSQSLKTEAPGSSSSTPTLAEKFSLNQSLSSATAASKKWLASRQTSISSLGVGGGGGGEPSPKASSTANARSTEGHVASDGSSAQTSPRVIGRGQPLPPPGTPLPLPPKVEKKSTWSVPTASTLVNLTRRKPVPIKVPSPPKNAGVNAHANANALGAAQLAAELVGKKASASPGAGEETPPPPLPRRRQRASTAEVRKGKQEKGSDARVEELLVVKVPQGESGSVPASPSGDGELMFPNVELDEGVT